MSNVLSRRSRAVATLAVWIVLAVGPLACVRTVPQIDVHFEAPASTVASVRVCRCDGAGCDSSCGSRGFVLEYGPGRSTPRDAQLGFDVGARPTSARVELAHDADDIVRVYPLSPDVAALSLRVRAVGSPAVICLEGPASPAPRVISGSAGCP